MSFNFYNVLSTPAEPASMGANSESKESEQSIDEQSGGTCKQPEITTPAEAVFMPIDAYITPRELRVETRTAAQLVAAARTTFNAILTKQGSIKHRLVAVPGAGMLKLTKLSREAWSDELLEELEASFIVTSDTLENMEFEKVFPAGSAVGQLLPEPFGVHSAYTAQQNAARVAAGEEEEEWRLKAAVLESSGRYANPKKQENMEYAGNKPMLAFGGVEQFQLHEAYVWAASHDSYKDHKFMLEATEEGELKLTNYGASIVIPATAESHDTIEAAFKDITGGTLVSSVSAYVSTKELSPKDFRGSGVGRKAIAMAFGEDTVASVGVNAFGADDTGVIGLFIKLYANAEDRGNATLLKLAKESAKTEGIFYPGIDVTVRWASTLASARERNGLVPFAEVVKREREGGGKANPELEAKLRELAEHTTASAKAQTQALADADARQTEISKALREQSELSKAAEEARKITEAKHQESVSELQAQLMALVEASKQNNANVAESIMKTNESVAAMAASHVSLTARLTGDGAGSGVARQIGFGDITEVTARCADRVRMILARNAQLCMESILEVESELAEIAYELERGARILLLLVHSDLSRVQRHRRRCEHDSTNPIGDQTREWQLSAKLQKDEDENLAEGEDAERRWRGAVSFSEADVGEHAQGSTPGVFAGLAGLPESVEGEELARGVNAPTTHERDRTKVRKHTWLVILLVVLGRLGRVTGSGSRTAHAVGSTETWRTENRTLSGHFARWPAALVERLHARESGIRLAECEDREGWSAAYEPTSAQNVTTVMTTVTYAICGRERTLSAMGEALSSVPGQWEEGSPQPGSVQLFSYMRMIILVGAHGYGNRERTCMCDIAMLRDAAGSKTVRRLFVHGGLHACGVKIISRVSRRHAVALVWLSLLGDLPGRDGKRPKKIATSHGRACVSGSQRPPAIGRGRPCLRSRVAFGCSSGAAEGGEQVRREARPIQTSGFDGPAHARRRLASRGAARGCSGHAGGADRGSTMDPFASAGPRDVCRGKRKARQESQRLDGFEQESKARTRACARGEIVNTSERTQCAAICAWSRMPRTKGGRCNAPLRTGSCPCLYRSGTFRYMGTREQRQRYNSGRVEHDRDATWFDGTQVWFTKAVVGLYHIDLTADADRQGEGSRHNPGGSRDVIKGGAYQRWRMHSGSRRSADQARVGWCVHINGTSLHLEPSPSRAHSACSEIQAYESLPSLVDGARLYLRHPTSAGQGSLSVECSSRDRSSSYAGQRRQRFGLWKTDKSDLGEDGVDKGSQGTCKWDVRWMRLHDGLLTEGGGRRFGDWLPLGRGCLGCDGPARWIRGHYTADLRLGASAGGSGSHGGAGSYGHSIGGLPVHSHIECESAIDTGTRDWQTGPSEARAAGAAPKPHMDSIGVCGTDATDVCTSRDGRRASQLFRDEAGIPETGGDSANQTAWVRLELYQIKCDRCWLDQRARSPLDPGGGTFISGVGCGNQRHGGSAWQHLVWRRLCCSALEGMRDSCNAQLRLGMRQIQRQHAGNPLWTCAHRTRRSLSVLVKRRANGTANEQLKPIPALFGAAAFRRARDDAHGSSENGFGNCTCRRSCNPRQSSCGLRQLRGQSWSLPVPIDAVIGNASGSMLGHPCLGKSCWILREALWTCSASLLRLARLALELSSWGHAVLTSWWQVWSRSPRSPSSAQSAWQPQAHPQPQLRPQPSPRHRQRAYPLPRPRPSPILALVLEQNTVAKPLWRLPTSLLSPPRKKPSSHVHAIAAHMSLPVSTAHVWGTDDERRYGLVQCMWRCRPIFWRVRWAFSHRAWNKLQHALHGNTACDVEDREELTVTVWNARNLSCKNFHIGGMADSASVAKREVLQREIDLYRPTVICLIEVDTEGIQDLRKWAGSRHYTMRFLLGKGGSARQFDYSSTSNGIVAMVANEQASFVRFRMSDEVEERVLGVELLHKREAASRVLTFMHGLHTKGQSSFETQIQRAVQTVAEAGGGVVFGDLNRVACTEWRLPRRVLSAADKMLRGLLGISGCSCCRGTEEDITGQLVSSEGWSDIFTRRENGGSEAERARLDIAIEFGDQISKWRLLEKVFFDVWGDQIHAFPSPHRMMSDHALMRFGSKVIRAAPILGARAKPALVQRGPLAATAKETYRQRVRGTAFKDQIRMTVQKEESPRVPGISRLLVGEGKAASQDAALQAARHRGGIEEQYWNWRERLNVALNARRSAVHPAMGSFPTLFHPKAGLNRVTKVIACMPTEEAWAYVTSCIRRKVRRLGKIASAVRQRKDQALIVAARRILADGEAGIAVNMKRAWDAMRTRGQSATMSAIYRGDVKRTEVQALTVVKAGRVSLQLNVKSNVITADSDEFLEELGRIGDQQVCNMASTPPILAAFKAWHEHFVPERDELAGSDGGKWTIEKEFTFEVFLTCLHATPRGKAVGATGFSIELLINADMEIKEAFYHALMADIHNGDFDANWRRVLYSLLVKPAPNDPNRVAERREIALMCQEMKLMMQMVRGTAYRRVVERIASEQLGWIAGYGATDPSLTIALVIQQAARLEHSLYVMFIDLATYFPRIDRVAARIADLRMGLPPEVCDLVDAIFPPNEGVSVQCQYDSAAGLSRPFSNHMGRLMGDVNAPDQAKIFLHSVLVAIRVVASGVPLWGMMQTDLDGYRKAVVQAAYADDWAAVSMNATEMVKFWDIWLPWSILAGAKLGVKGVLKTVVTGVAYVDHRPVDAVDPCLPFEGGTLPFLGCDALYKHLGNWRAASGNGEIVWRRRKGTFQAVIARIRKMHKSTRAADICTVADGMLGGLASYYCATEYLTWTNAEQIERAFTGAYNTITKRSRNSIRAELYVEDGAQLRKPRAHIWSVALASLAASFGQALADVHNTTQRAAARSALALALHQWGCRSDPRTWNHGHLKEALFTRLEKGRVKYLADAFLYALLLDPHEGDTWRWAQDVEEGDPLHPDNPHFMIEGSLVFEPGGTIEAKPCYTLTSRGFVSVGHFCRHALCGKGVAGRLFETAKEMQLWHAEALGGLSHAELGEVQHCLDWLHSVGAAPEPPIRPAAWAARRDPGLGHDCGSLPRMEVRAHVDRREVDKFLAGLRCDDGSTTAEEWGAQIARCYAGSTATRELDWSMGGTHWEEKALGACTMAVMESGAVERSGGSARWLQRDGVGDDGYIQGWESEVARMERDFRLDEEGFVVDRDAGARVTRAGLAELPVAIQLYARSRLDLGDREIRHGRRVKREETHVNIDESRHMFAQLVRWQARVQPTHAVTLDGTKQQVTIGKMTQTVGARAGVFHDGSVTGGVLEEAEGDDNYLAELAAQIDAFRDLEGHCRVVVIFDATSPVRSMLNFRAVGARARQSKHIARWLETFDYLAARPEVAVFLWQPSHCGEPCNERADLAADEAAQSLERRPVCKSMSRFASMQFPAWRTVVVGELETSEFDDSPLRRRIAAASQRVAQDRLLETRVHTPTFQAGEHLQVGKFDDALELTRRALLGQRCQMADGSQVLGRWHTVAADGYPCPHGCVGSNGVGAAFSWVHVRHYCQYPRYVDMRKREIMATEHALATILRLSSGSKHDVRVSGGFDQMVRYVQRAKQGCPGWSSHVDSHPSREAWLRSVASGVPCSDPGPVIPSEIELAGGLVVNFGAWRVPRAALRLIHTATAEGLRMQSLALADSKETRFEVREAARAMRLCHTMISTWRAKVDMGGQRRRAALREVRDERANALEELRTLLTRGVISRQQRQRRRAHVVGSAALLGAQRRNWYPRSLMPDVSGWIKTCVFYAWWNLVELRWLARDRNTTEARELMMSGVRREPIESEVVDALTDEMLSERRRHAMRQWARAGGWAALEKRATTIRRVAAAQALEAQRAALKRFREGGTLSGGAPIEIDPEERICWDFTEGRESAPKRRRKAAARARATKRRRWHTAAAESALRSRAQRTGDAKGAYPIECILDVRLVGGSTREVEALVRWEGAHWVGWDSWEPLGHLTADLRQEAELEAARRFPPGPPERRTIPVPKRRAMIDAALVGRRLLRRSGEMTRSVRLEDAEDETVGEDIGAPRATRVLREVQLSKAQRRRARRGKSRILLSDGESEAEDMNTA